eukprot:6164278-Amphidinium_carterae.1
MIIETPRLESFRLPEARSRQIVGEDRNWLMARRSECAAPLLGCYVTPCNEYCWLSPVQECPDAEGHRTFIAMPRADQHLKNNKEYEWNGDNVKANSNVVSLPIDILCYMRGALSCINALLGLRS